MEAASSESIRRPERSEVRAASISPTISSRVVALLSIAADSGDIYFYSPELLDGPENGLDGAQNLYVYRNGQVEFVAQLNTDGHSPVTRMQVSPNGEHTAFITASALTSYDNAGFEEMYSYEPSSKELICVSCNPDGEPPQHDVEGSMNGLFMSNDGRTFWTTVDPLVVHVRQLERAIGLRVFCDRRRLGTGEAIDRVRGFGAHRRLALLDDFDRRRLDR